MLLRLRSLVFVIQVVALTAVIVTLAVDVGMSDPVAFGQQLLAQIAESMRERGMAQYADLLVANQADIARQVTALFVMATWLQWMVALVLGNALFRSLPDRTTEFGRFSDLNLGRVLAGIAAVSSLLAWFAGADWLGNVALVAFGMFMLQGIALMHWLYEQGPLPWVVVVMAYVLLPFLNALLITAFAVTGYIDAWFDYRRRLRRNKPAD